MFKKKKGLLSLAGAAILSVGAISSNTGQTAQAATSEIQLTKNSFVYTKQGVRKSKKTLRKGQSVTVYGITNIKGKKYYRLSKGRYIKAANADKTHSSHTSDAYQVTVTKTAAVFNAKGKFVGETLRVGTNVLSYGTIKIKGYQYYKLGSNRYILTSMATKNSVDNNNGQNENGSTDNPTSNNKQPQLPGKSDKPTQQEIDKLLANSNDELGYVVYFSDDQLAQVQQHLWEKIQKYRIENGYPAFKSDSELDSFIKKVSSTSDNMFSYADDINSADIGKYLPNLTSKGMNAVRAVDNYRYYGNYLGAPAVFNIKDRNPEHVATEIFNSLKSDDYYNRTILGKNDQLSFGSLGLNYYWDGRSSCVGLVFAEVTGSSSDWANYYNQK